MNGFDAQLAACNTFFATVAQVSGGLLGLVFVAMTFNPEKLGLRHDGVLRGLAQQVYLDFLGVLVVSLLLVVPLGGRGRLGALLLAIAAVFIVRMARSMVAQRRDLRSRPALWQRLGLSVLGHLGFAGGAVLLLLPQGDVERALFLLISGVLALLVAGSRSVWLLLTENAG